MFGDQENFKKEISRKDFIKLMGAGSLFLGLGTFGVSNFLKTFEASAGKIDPPLINEGNSSNTTQTSSNTKSSYTADDLADPAIERRAVEDVIWGMPAVNYYLMYQEMVNKVGGGFNQVLYWSRLPRKTRH